MKKIFIIFGIAFLLILISFFIYGIASGPRLFKDHEKRTIKIGKVKYSLYVSDTESKRMQGLSDVAKMPKKQGMLFVFEKADTYGFWMKDMKFPLDMIFLRENQIVDLKQNILESSFPQIFYPISAVDAVIELNTGEIQKSGVHIGDVLKVSK
jgi:uncharacterized membrane protein (UPF0127 family)